MSVNLVVLLGHLTRDPELRYTPNGSAVCQFGLALNRRYRTAAGALQEDTWETESGERRSRLEVVAQRVTFLPRNGAASGTATEDALPEWVAEEA